MTDGTPDLASAARRLLDWWDREGQRIVPPRASLQPVAVPRDEIAHLRAALAAHDQQDEPDDDDLLRPPEDDSREVVVDWLALNRKQAVTPVEDRTCPYVETGDEGTSYCRLAEAGDRPTREHGIPRYAMLDVWMALGGTPAEFDSMWSEPRRTPADTWAQLMAVVKDREHTDLTMDTNPPFGPEFTTLVNRLRVMAVGR